MLTYGVIGGFGLGLIYLPAVVAVGYYFEKRRALATGISVCGSGVGTFLFAPLSTALLNAVDWKAANLVFAGTQLPQIRSRLMVEKVCYKRDFTSMYLTSV